MKSSAEMHYGPLVAFAKRDRHLVPNHRNVLVPMMERALAQAEANLSMLRASRVDSPDLVAMFEQERTDLLRYLDFYKHAKVPEPGAPRRSWNPHYVAYAKAHGHEPQQQLDCDTERWPGGCMCGFLLWMGEMKEAFFKASPKAFLNRWTICDHDAWGRFLVAQTLN